MIDKLDLRQKHGSQPAHPCLVSVPPSVLVSKVVSSQILVQLGLSWAVPLW